MTTTYDLSNNIGKVRLALGDTASPWLFSDEEITSILTTYSNGVLTSAAALADALASRYGRMVSQSVDGASFSYGERAQFYLSLATRLRAQAANNSGNGIGDAFVGGLSKGEMAVVDSDADRFPSSFEIGRTDNDKLQ